VSQIWRTTPHGPTVPPTDFKLNDVDGVVHMSTSNTNHTLAPNNQKNACIRKSWKRCLYMARGHLVSVDGILLDPEKVDTVRNWH
jgi:hypothetical protein